MFLLLCDGMCCAVQLAVLWCFHCECSKSIIDVITVIQVWLRPLFPLTETSCADTHHLWALIIQTRECARTSMLSIKLSERDYFTFFHLFPFFSLQKWKPKGTALQHMVSGLCLDSQTPTGPPVITQCRPQVASQTWEPQVITWATAGGGEGGKEGADSGPGLQKDSEHHICTLSVALQRDGRSEAENCTAVMSTSSSCSLCFSDKSVTKKKTFLGLVEQNLKGLLCTVLHPSRMLQFFYVI